MTDSKFRYFTQKKKIDNFDMSKIIVFDVETFKGLECTNESFGFAAVYTNNFKKIFFTIESLKEYFYNECQNKFVFAHNAIFDLQCVFENIFENLDERAIFNGSSFIMAKSDKVTFLDSFNLLPMSVEKIGKSIGLEKIENEKVKAGDLNKYNVSQSDYIYCLRDCEIVYNALIRMFNFLGFFKITLASCSLEYFRRNFFKGSHYVHPLNDYFFNSYYGGRVECFRLGKQIADVFDINSLYPYIMSTIILPDFSNLKIEKNISVEKFLLILKYYEGCADVTINHKDTYIGYLPTRYENKLIFPNGNFNTTLNFNEIRFALESGVIEIISVSNCVYGERINTIFSEFVEFFYKLRTTTIFEFDKLFYKLILNALYGKFGARPQKDFIYMQEFDPEFILELERKNLDYKISMFSKDRTDSRVEYEKEKKHYLSYAITSIASYITSEARILLLKNMLKNEKNLCYCDTDSIFIKKDTNFIGNVDEKILGYFKKENKTILEINGLKNYKYLDENKIIKETIKGVSKNSFYNIEKKQYENLKYYKTKQGLINHKTGKLYLQIKKLTFEYNKRQILFCKNTIPLKF